MFEIKLTKDVNGLADTLRYHPGTNGLISTIVFDGKSYPAVPVEADGFSASSKGTLPRPTIKIANTNNAISALLLSSDPSDGEKVNILNARVRRIRTFAKFLDISNFNQNQLSQTEGDDDVITQGGDNIIYQTFNDTADPDAKIVETWYIDRIASENLQFVEFELTAKLDLTNLQLPRRTVTEFCQWEYRSRECTYNGDRCFTINDTLLTSGTLSEKKKNDVCGKRLSSCEARFPKGSSKNHDALPFGGFPGARLQI